MVEAAADEFVQVGQALLDKPVKDWDDNDWVEWERLINVFRRTKSEVLNTTTPFQNKLFDTINEYFAVRIPFEQKKLFFENPFEFNPMNFRVMSDAHSVIVEHAVKDVLTYVAEVQKQLHRLFPILRIHQKGIAGLIDRLNLLEQANERLEEELRGYSKMSSYPKIGSLMGDTMPKETKDVERNERVVEARKVRGKTRKKSKGNTLVDHAKPS